MIQNKMTSTAQGTTLARWLTTFLFLASGTAFAGDLTALSWEDNAGTPSLQVWVSGSPAYEIQTLDAGQRLRLRLSDTVLRDVTDVEGRGVVKGVYPYLSDTGTGVHVDFLLTEPGQLRVEPATYGYRVIAQAVGGNAAKAAEVEKPEAKAAVPIAPTVAPKAAAVAAKSTVPENSIEDIVYAKLPGDRIQIQLRMTGTPAKPAVFTTSNPARIALDFPNTRVSMARTSVKVGVGAITSVNAIEAQNRTRVVLNLVKPAAYTSSSDGRSFTITVENPVGAVAGTQAAKTTRFASAVRPGKHSLKGIDFRRGPQGDGKIVIGLSDTGVGIDIREQAGEIIVDFLDTGIPAELQRRLDVTDFGTPVTNIDTFVQGKNVRLVIVAKGKYEHLAYQAGEQFTVNVKPIVEKPGEKKKDEFGYSGDKLSLNFQNIDVRAALQVIADFTNLNFVTSDSVKGNLTLRLKDVPWDQALDIIATAKNLAIRKSGNVVTVGPADEVAAKEKAALEAGKSVMELEALVSELVQVNYSKAEDIAKLLKSIKAIEPAGRVAGGGAGGLTVTTPPSNVRVDKVETESNTLLSPRGQVTVDERTNTLLIQDTPSKIREVRKLIAALDQPVRQVMIETRLVEARDTFAKNLGVKWGVAAHGPVGSSGSSAVGTTCGTLGCAENLVNGLPIGISGTTSAPSALSVNLGASGIGNSTAASIATILQLPAGNLLSLELSALEEEGQGKVISSPRLITANQKKARIEQGQERVFQVVTAQGVTALIKKAVLALEVTPRITPDDKVILDVLITKDNFNSADPQDSTINKKEITTQVLLDNGQTVVIGGIYEQELINTVTKVPFLADVPLMGWLFNKKSRLDNKTELLIFLTPRILSDTLSLR
jgi:type IV pilus assembly protein PilQ